MQAGPILDTEGVIPGEQFFEKRAFACLHPLNICHFSTISSENILFKTQDTKLGAIIDLTVSNRAWKELHMVLNIPQ